MILPTLLNRTLPINVSPTLPLTLPRTLCSVSSFNQTDDSSYFKIFPCLYSYSSSRGSKHRISKSSIPHQVLHNAACNLEDLTVHFSCLLYHGYAFAACLNFVKLSGSFDALLVYHCQCRRKNFLFRSPQAHHPPVLLLSSRSKSELSGRSDHRCR